MEQYSFTKTLWKAVRPALIVAGGAALTAFVQNVDASTLTGAGVPAIVALVLIEGLRNFAKHWGRSIE